MPRTRFTTDRVSGRNIERNPEVVYIYIYILASAATLKRRLDASWARAHLGPGPFGPGPVWARAHLGPGPFGPGPIWAQAHLAPGPFGPGPIWPGAHLGPFWPGPIHKWLWLFL
jgi:hypothetical protein